MSGGVRGRRQKPSPTRSYEGKTYQLTAGDGVFIDCRKEYSHSTGYNCAGDDDSKENLWFLQWCHFYAPCLPAVYEKYRERGGRLVFHPDDIRLFTDLLLELYDLSASSDYIRDMRINKKLTTDEIGNAVGMGK